MKHGLWLVGLLGSAGHSLSNQRGRRLQEWDDNDPTTNYMLIVGSIFLVVFAGLMSGLTLGLMSLDAVDMEVLIRSGSEKEKKYARKILPVIKNTHWLLCTLLLCNAMSMEMLPLFLDRLADPLTAILLSVTAVLFFGEIIPQAVCTRYGLVIGARLAPAVSLLMIICSPLSWPIGKVLDLLLGHEQHVLFRRKQLKALVDIHGEGTDVTAKEEKLTREETKIITGALDLSHKTAFDTMTPLDKVFMVSTDDKLDKETLQKILDSGHSRIPVYVSGCRHDIVGLVLVKELLQYRMSASVPVSMLKLRSLPRLSAATPLYDLLRLFQVGRSHMAVLTQPTTEEVESMEAQAEASLSHYAGSQVETSANFRADREDGVQDRSQERGSVTIGSSVATSGGGRTNWPDSFTSWVARCAQHSDVPPGTPIGIITLEDVIEELISAEIVDETDQFVDNERLVHVNAALLTQNLPDQLRKVLSVACMAAEQRRRGPAAPSIVGKGPLARLRSGTSGLSTPLLSGKLSDNGFE